jgi:hypothetical protein
MLRSLHGSLIRTEADVSHSSGKQRSASNNEIVFRNGHYRPGTVQGDRLLAHELTHVVQASNGSSKTASMSRGSDASEREADRVADQVAGATTRAMGTRELGSQSRPVVRESALPLQRKIMVGDDLYVPSKKYLRYLEANFGPPMVEFMVNMHNGGKPPEYKFDSLEQMGYEVRIRSSAMDAMADANSSQCCDYPRNSGDGYLDDKYWTKEGPYMFTMKSPLPKGAQPSDAIEAIFVPQAGTELDCNTMMVAVSYRAMLDAMGEEEFNARFTGSSEIAIAKHHKPPPAYTHHPIHGLYKRVTIDSFDDLLPGDWVYFSATACFKDSARTS